MEFNDIKQLAALMRDMGLVTLDYTDGAASIRLERAAAVVQAAPVAVEVKAAEPVAAAPDSAAGTYTVTSPMVGVFYAAPATDKQPYVSLGDHVNVGDVLCIIEAMKMMNEITAEKSGVITEICAGNKQIVEYGHPLFRISQD
ncbi:acetyl-CoA carboxylase biotin carboxyl carrier protein [Oscillospiraceae bacterium WX1]